MILKLFSSKYILFQVGIIVAFFALMLNRDIALNAPQGFGPIYSFIYQLLVDKPLAIFITFTSLIIIEGLLLQLIVSYYKLTPRNNYIVLLIWLILVFSNPSKLSINPVLIATIVSTWALFRLLSLNDKDDTIPNLFTAGFLFSTASLLYGNLLWLVVFLILALLILSIFRGHELLVSLISFALPYVFLLAYGFISEQNFIIWQNLNFTIGEWVFFENGVQLIISISITVLVIVLSVFGVSKTMLQLFSKLIQIRKIISTLFAFLIFTVLLQFFSGPWWFAHPLIVFVPLSIILSIFIAEQKKNFYLDLFISSIILLEIAQLYYLHYA